jgi:hypothetical protein
MKKRTPVLGAILAATALLGASLAPVFASTASTPVSSGGVVPLIIAGENAGGNRTCAEVGLALYGDANYYQFSSARVNYDKDTSTFDAAFPAGITVSTGGTYVTWSSSFGIGAVIVKGRNDANVYVYDPQSNGDSGLAAPPNASGGPAGLSNITFCWNPEEEEESQWCSPGYWRQPHHLDSWEATGISPSAKYSAYFPPVQLSKKAKADGATADPTLWQVLQSPQWYGGAAFNNVGDLLSAAHPDVNFTGERVEDSCPLS